ncbi:MAG: ribose 5-phosphate isomerase B, partial [Deltaproteobacteria bacterium]
MTTEKEPLIIGSDHAAYELKENIKAFLTKAGYPVEDAGTHNTESVNYPEYGHKVASRVADGTFSRGILMCGTGLGMSMVANKYPGIRAALCNGLFSALMSRRHNNANILVMGGRVIGVDLAHEIVKVFLKTDFEG